MKGEREGRGGGLGDWFGWESGVPGSARVSSVAALVWAG